MTEKVAYTRDEFVAAYLAWVDAAKPIHFIEDPVARAAKISRDRQIAWEKYCDVRDELPHGTTQSRRIAGGPLRLVACRATIPAVESDA